MQWVQEVVHQPVEHQSDEEEEEQIGQASANLDGNRSAGDSFDGEEEDVPAIKQGEREDVDHGQIEAEHSQNPDEIVSSLLEGLRANLNDAHDAVEVVARGSRRDDAQ